MMKEKMLEVVKDRDLSLTSKDIEVLFSYLENHDNSFFTPNSTFLIIGDKNIDPDDLEKLFLGLSSKKVLEEFWYIDCENNSHRMTASNYHEFCNVVRSKICKVCSSNLNVNSAGIYFSKNNVSN